MVSIEDFIEYLEAEVISFYSEYRQNYGTNPKKFPVEKDLNKWIKDFIKTIK